MFKKWNLNQAGLLFFFFFKNIWLLQIWNPKGGIWDFGILRLFQGIWEFWTLTEVVRLMGERMNGKGGSSSSSSSSPAMVKWKCEVPTIVFMSHSVNHLGKRFWRCPHWNVSKCKLCFVLDFTLFNYCIVGIQYL